MQLIEKPRTEETRRYEMLVGGEWVEARSGKTFESVNPYTGRVWATAPEAGEEDVDRAVRAAREAFDEGPWGTMTGTQRARLMRRLAELIAENAESLAVVESDGQRQAAAGDERPAGGPARVVLLLRRGGRQDPGRHHPLPQARTSSCTRAASLSGWWVRSCPGTRRSSC